MRETGFIFLFDGNKNLLISPPEERYGTFCRIDEQKKCFDDLMRAGRMKKDGRVDIEVTQSGSKTKFAIYTSYFKGFDWYTSIVVPEDELDAPGNRLLWKQFFVIFGIFIICLIACIFMVARLTTPLGFLSHQLERIPEIDFTGDEDEEIVKALKKSYGSRKDEIGSLIRTFAFMMTELDDNIKRLIKTVASNERMESELNVARDIQLGGLPTDFTFNEHKELELYAYLVPARAIGGDLYDFYFLDDEHFCFVLGDVAGKGVPAALFMVTAKKLIKHIAICQGTHSPAEIMTQLNEILYQDNFNATFITLFIGILNVKTGTIRYANGGHVPPIFTELDTAPWYRKELSGPVVGVIPGVKYKEISLLIQPGECIFLCTDGVTEAMNEEDALFGEPRLLEEFTRLKDTSCRDVVENILHEVREHAGNAPQSDDIAMMMFRWNTEPEQTEKTTGEENNLKRSVEQTDG